MITGRLPVCAGAAAREPPRLLVAHVDRDEELAAYQNEHDSRTCGCCAG
jgi:hypothetical protein